MDRLIEWDPILSLNTNHHMFEQKSRKDPINKGMNLIVFMRLKYYVCANLIL